ncbi:hypothetical protein ANCCEY_06958 [Ancylostoma ceylanicum]|uniref:Uncharacterized protein n=1 Tax=Ancylostoma ceylanicum TaxID=53326 RepID=A0A0D6LQ04_9BILA|nr:hypothetical protein ANCCEY_06958 [Ancylostoma ceylanicum]
MPVLTTSLNSSLGPAVCRVCLCGEASIPYLGNAPGEPLISPCHCKRKRGFLSYLRAHWFVDGEHSHSVGGDCACLLILSPLTLGGAVLCIQSVSEKLRYVNENGDFEKAHEVLALGLMALFLIIVFGFWVMFTVLFYLNDFRIWQKKNVILYVIDQLEREDETYNRSHNYLSESLRPLLLKKKLKNFFCCALDRSSREDTVIPLGDGVLDVNPQLVETDGSPANDAGEPRAFRPLLVSPISCASDAPVETNQDLNLSTSILMGSPVPPNNERVSTTTSEVPALSTFRPYYTVASARVLASTPLESSPLSTIERLITDRTGSSASDEGLRNSAEVLDVHPSTNSPEYETRGIIPHRHGRCRSSSAIIYQRDMHVQPDAKGKCWDQTSKTSVETIYRRRCDEGSGKMSEQEGPQINNLLENVSKSEEM